MSERIFDSKNTNKVSMLIQSMNIALSASDTAIELPKGQFGFTALIETDKTALRSEDFDFEYDIPFDDDLVPNEAKITLYNLSKSTRNNFKKDNILTITAGYGADTGVILKGKISDTNTKHDDLDLVTTVYVLDNVDYTDSTIIEQTFSENTKASDILKSLLAMLKLPIEVFKIQRDHTYENTTTVKGSITDNIKNYADVCGVSVYVNKQRIFCRPIWDGDNTHFTICSETGMIGSPEPFEESSTSEQYKDTVKGYTIKMLMQHRMNTAAITYVSSKDCSGTFRVCSGKHTFDGLSAQTEIKCISDISTEIVETSSSASSSSSSANSSGGSTSLKAEAVIQIAEGEIGTAETGNNNNKYGKALGQNGVAWCGLFVAWCIKQACGSLPGFNYASALAFAYAAQHNGWGTYHAQGSGYTPKRGDIFVRNYNGTAFSSNAHVGFVRSSSGSSFVTVEGNSSDKVNTRTLNSASYTFVTPPY